jgi:microtubule-associated protein-like 1/2
LEQARNLWVLEKGGELVYYVGAFVVIYHRMDETQRHYTGHTEDIQCMDIHPQVRAYFC